jgi:hypothetical protein
MNEIRQWDGVCEQCCSLILPAKCETTVLYMPEQNGIAESAIRVRFEMVRCMLHLAGMDL